MNILWMTIGVFLIILGVTLIWYGMRGKARTSGVILIGFIPIIWGEPSEIKWLLPLLIGVIVLSFLIVVVSYYAG